MKNDIMIYTVKDNYVLGDNIQSSVLAFAFSLAAQIERDMIALRTKEALMVRKKAGVILGTPRSPKKVSRVSDDQMAVMIRMAEDGHSLVKIAETVKLHRLTVGYHLANNSQFKGCLHGYKITYANGNTFHMTRRNAAENGLYYKHISSAVEKGIDLSHIGISKAEPVYRPISIQIRESVKVSSNVNIERDFMEKLIDQGYTIPEIHQKLPNVTYDEIYDYIADDTFLSMEYRKKGQNRVRKPKERR